MRDKPIILWPAIIVYKIVSLLFKIPFLAFHYMLVGIFYSLYSTITIFVDLGMFISLIWWKIMKYIGYALAFPFVLLKGKPQKKENKKIDVKKNEKVSTITGDKVDAKKNEKVLTVKDKKRLAKEEKAKLKHQQEMERLKKKVEAKEKEDKVKLSKLEAKRKKEEEAKLEEEKKAEIIEQKELLKQAKEKDEREKRTVLASGTMKDNNINQESKKVLTKKEEKAKKRLEKIEAKKKAKEEEKKRKDELKREKQKLKDKNVYINEDVKIEPKTLGDRINNVLEALIAGPKKAIEKAKKKVTDNALIRNKRNEDLMQREALLINFDGDDAKKSDKKLVYEYVGKSAEGKIVKDYFEAFSKVEVHSFLLSEGFEVYSIKTSGLIQFLHGSGGKSKGKIKNKDMIFFLTQLSTYIKAGIPLVESLRILSRQFKEKSYEKIFRSLIYELTMGDNFSDAMAKQGNSFPRILVNMVKASEMTGELPETLDDMADYFGEMEKTKKQMITALTYPAIIFVLAICAIVFIMIYIVPQFVTIYEDMDNAELPWITVAVLVLSEFLKKYLILLIIGIIGVIFIFVWLYKNVKIFRTMIQWMLMKLPIIGNVIIYNEVTMFTKTFASLLKHNVFITDSMEILNKITNNEIWKMIILDTITNLAKGDKISLAFQDHWAVPIPAYEMIVTGERTGQLPEMMQKVSDYYQELHKNQVGRIKAFVEPILILFLTGAVGLIVMSIIIPMFGMYSQLS